MMMDEKKLKNGDVAGFFCTDAPLVVGMVGPIITTINRKEQGDCSKPKERKTDCVSMYVRRRKDSMDMQLN